MTDVRAQLLKDHEELAALLRCLAEDTAAPERGALQTTWCQVESRLLTHMDAEERYLLPLLETMNPVETERIRAEHAQIRALVAKLGVAIELHTAREPAIVHLIGLLQQHAKDEDRLLYTLGSQRAPAHVQDKIATLLSAARFAMTRAVGGMPRSLSEDAQDE